MKKMIQDMMVKVDDFQKVVLKAKYTDGLPDVSRYDHMIEEMREIIEAHIAGDIAGVIDGLVDCTYIMLGTLLRMGVPPDWAFDIVHDANMKKYGGKTERHEMDAIKPDGWEPPDHTALLEHMQILNQVSPIFVNLTRLRMKKGNNYNSISVKRIDHFPLGDLSYFQVMWMKMCRVRALLEKGGDRKLIEREVNDILVYGCFWEEFMTGLGDIEK